MCIDFGLNGDSVDYDWCFLRSRDPALTRLTVSSSPLSLCSFSSHSSHCWFPSGSSIIICGGITGPGDEVLTVLLTPGVINTKCHQVSPLRWVGGVSVVPVTVLAFFSILPSSSSRYDILSFCLSISFSLFRRSSVICSTCSAWRRKHVNTMRRSTTT